MFKKSCFFIVNEFLHLFCNIHFKIRIKILFEYKNIKWICIINIMIKKIIILHTFCYLTINIFYFILLYFLPFL